MTFTARLLILIDNVTRRVFTFIENFTRIIRIVCRCMQMLRSILSAIHLLVARLMILIFKVYQIFNLLSILLEPLSNRIFEKIALTFMHSIYEYYSSNGACYSLKVRVKHFVKRIRANWKKDDDIYYDAINE